MMKIIFSLSGLILSFNFLAACSGSQGGSGTTVQPLPDGAAAYAPVVSGTNVLPVQVSSGYVNEPVVSVVVCEPGSATNCVTINRVLLDTGSSGLRVFGSLVSSLNLTQVYSSSKEVAKCTYYGDGTTQWGPVKTANVVLGGETVSNVNIQIIDASYKAVPSACGTPESSPTTAQYNGILGIGIRDQDCGSGCATTAGNNLYFSCATSGTSCSSAMTALNLQVRNPIAAMTSASNSNGIDDSNGSLLILPSIPSTGAVSASGYLIFGVGGRSNNTPAGGTTTFRTDSNGYFYTTFNGTSNIRAFIDSGSNGLFFPSSSSTPSCSSGWFCPSSTVTLSATQKGYLTAVTKTVNFEVINAQQVFVSSNQAYANLGSSNSEFDWGLPFFYGRSVYTGIDGKNSTLNANAGYPYYAY